MEIHEKTYKYGKYLFWIFYIIYILGVWSKSPQYLNIINDLFMILVGCILVYLFNPIYDTKTTPFHKKIAFDAGVMILFSSSLTNILLRIPIIKNIVQKYNKL